MRATFLLLTFILIAVSFWAVWVDGRPEWRRYQEELRERSTTRLNTMMEEAREDLDRYEVQAQIASIDARLAVLEADSSARTTLSRDLADRLRETRREIQASRTRLRRAEAVFAAPEVSRRHRARLALLAQARDEYARLTGQWPQDEERLLRSKRRCDSLTTVLAVSLHPVDSLLAVIDSLRVGEVRIREESALLDRERDSLRVARERILAPIARLETALLRIEARPPGVREIVSPDGREVARCPTCHGALDDFPAVHPAMTSRDVFRETPCTVCHRGDGRALDVEHAHRGLLTGAGRGAGPYSLQARIDHLSHQDPKIRREALEELHEITGIDPSVESVSAAPSDSALVAAWRDWWSFARRYFETTDDPASGFATSVASGLASGAVSMSAGSSAPAGSAAGSGMLLPPDGVDPWSMSTAGRPLRYVGSQECLGCHRTLHRAHSERWIGTKFQSLARMADDLEVEPEPELCYPCHATGYDPATGAYVEPGVTCEGCHGPGERYSEMMLVGVELNGRGETGRGKELLDWSSRLAREATSVRMVEGDYGPINLCVSCHHPRRHKDGGPGPFDGRVSVVDTLVASDALETGEGSNRLRSGNTVAGGPP